jgi:hypothetical protein
MATKFDGTMAHATNATDAQFRTWCQFFDNLLVTTGGWTHMADTGQANLTTIVRPASAGQFNGYKVYTMADALNATHPVVMRLDFGWGGTTATPALMVQIGTGSDGAGTITGSIAGPFTITNGTNSSATNNYGSADTNRVQFLMGISNTNVAGIMFTLERTKDATGADTGDGLLLAWSNPTGPAAILVKTQAPLLVAGSQPSAELGVTLALSNQASSAFGSDVGVGVPLYFRGTVLRPGLGAVVVNSGDFAAQASFPLTLYGVAHTYQLSGNSGSQVGVPTGNGAASVRSLSLVGIRYE